LAGVLFGNFRSAELHTEAALTLLRHMPGYYATMHAHLLRALVLAAQLRDGVAGQQALSGELQLHTDWLAARAADQPVNFLHLLRLVQAESAWAQKDLWQASLAFDAALSLVETSERPWQRALITERAALFHLQQRMGHAGPSLLVRARDQYRAWGALGKVKAMEGAHAWLADVAPESDEAARSGARASGGVLPETLDLMGVLRASQALSSETSLERLTLRVTEVLAALTGATHVSVLSRHDEQWWLLAPGRGERSMPAHEAASLGLLSLAAVGYAERTGEALLVDDATRDERFARDAYFAGQSHCSLLVLPIASQGASRAMLLLENRLAHAAFNAQRLDAAMLIAGQLAVSLANVQLYETLEERVQARTRELRDTQAELVATARRAGMAEVANSVLHNVGNVLNSVNVSAVNVVGRMTQSKTLSLKRAMSLMNEHVGDLGRFLSHDDRGRTLPAYLNQLADALVQERDDVLAELDRLTRNVDHIKAIVANQQAHAGKSSLVEMVRPHDLIEEALHMSEREIAQHSVTALSRCEELPLLLLDKPRVLQILVNLLRNGAQAMGSVSVETRELVIEAGMAWGEDAEQLRIRVRDKGVGIASADLDRIFSHGFTTKKDGHGFGLHSSALAAMEMGGRLSVESDGPGCGATFTLKLPVSGRRN
jgi:signal transduction histidine kinase